MSEFDQQGMGEDTGLAAADRDPGGKIRDRVAIVLLSICVFSVYTLTIGKAHSWDAIAYTARVDDHPMLSDVYLSTSLFHPHHLLYVVFGKALAAFVGLFGEGRDTFWTLQMGNTLFGSLTILLVGLTLRRSTRNPLLVLGVPAGLAFSNAMWTFSVEVEVMMPAIALLSAGVYSIYRSSSSVRWGVGGLCFALAVLIHQIAIIPALAFTFVSLMEWRRDKLPRASFLSFLFVWGSLVVVVYLAIGLLWAGATNASEFADWVFSVRSRNTFFSLPILTTLKQTIRSAVSVLIVPTAVSIVRGDKAITAFSVAGMALFSIALAMIAVVCTLACSRVVRRWRNTDFIVRGGVLSVLFLALFIIWFEPRNIEYWLYILPFAALIVGISSLERPALKDKVRNARFRGVLIIAGIAGMAGTNLFYQALPGRHPESASYFDVLAFSQTHFHADDLLVSGDPSSWIGNGIIALPYFHDVEVFPVSTDENFEQRERLRVLLEPELTIGKSSVRRVFVSEDAASVVHEIFSDSIQLERLGHVRGRVIYRILPLPGPLPGLPG